MEKMLTEAVDAYVRALFLGDDDQMLLPTIRTLIEEIMSGALIAETLEGTRLTDPFPDQIAALYVCAISERGFKFMAKLFVSARNAEALDLLGAIVGATTVPFDAEKPASMMDPHAPPMIAAAAAAVRDEGGILSYRLYRHPEVTWGQALLMMKFIRLQADEALQDAVTEPTKDN